MNYMHKSTDGQMKFSQEHGNYLMIPSNLEGFNNIDTAIVESKSGRTVYCFNGTLTNDMDRTCNSCGSGMHVNNHFETTLRHLCFGSALTMVRFEKLQLRCPDCGATVMQDVPFKSKHHRITEEL